MYCIEIPTEINNIISLFYYIGIWHRGDKPTFKETRIKLFYCTYYLLFPISLMAAAIKSDNKDESILSAEVSIVTGVLSMKLYYIISRKETILEMLTCLGVYSIEDRKEFTLINDKLKRFVKFVKIVVIISIAGCNAVLAVTPF